MKIGVILLAAGSSKRMGTAKQLLKLHEGTTLLQHVIRNLVKSKAHSITCVLGFNSNNIAPTISQFPIRTIINSEFEKGIGNSISCGAKSLRKEAIDGIMIVLGDQPLIDHAYIDQLINEFYKSPHKIIASKYFNHFGVPAIFPKTLYQDLTKLKGDVGAKKLINSRNVEIIGIGTNEDLLLDIDTPEEYQKFLKN